LKRIQFSWFILLVTGLCLLPGLPIDGADLTGGYDWKQMKIGGGGWVVGHDRAKVME